ncbi:hypothetical protein SAMN04487988_11345 [Algoriphagus hitonicola]|uniref:Uncharacterized protein n=1 Tax=Algoriphagus hitonicola TaxID=435880 RepID=A0A1I2WKD2_9BACT|nr:hypothetical protein SAMN04487988_11345 [Algoriphagus hitonicola]
MHEFLIEEFDQYAQGRPLKICNYLRLFLRVSAGKIVENRFYQIPGSVLIREFVANSFFRKPLMHEFLFEEFDQYA